MKRAVKRTDRIAEEMQRLLAQVIQQELKDPRLHGLITLSAVDVAPNLSHAKVYFTSMQDAPDLVESVLNTAAGFLRMALAKSMALRTVPQLHFIYDNSIAYGKNLSKLIDAANADDKSHDDDM